MSEKKEKGSTADLSKKVKDTNSQSRSGGESDEQRPPYAPENHAVTRTAGVLRRLVPGRNPGRHGVGRCISFLVIAATGRFIQGRRWVPVPRAVNRTRWGTETVPPDDVP